MIVSAGKLRKNVDAYVLLPPDAKQSIDLLIETSAAVGVPPTNPYIFARMLADSSLSGHTSTRSLRKSRRTVLI
jgi:hypothetical protein